MTSHSDIPSHEMVEEGSAAEKLNLQSSTGGWDRTAGKIRYWWCLFCAGALLLIFGPPAIIGALILGRPHFVYPWAEFGARNWLRLCGTKVVVKGKDLIDPKQTYVFISNHRSYLDTATLFLHTGRRIGLLAKKELLKVPILGYGMGFVNVMAIDRSNRERALETTEAATARIRSGISFGIFAEGTRAKPGEFLPFKKGAFYMAVQAGVPIVPVAMKNTDLLMGKRTGVAKGGTIEMVILPPVSTSDPRYENDVSELIEKVHAAIAEELDTTSSSPPKAQNRT
jgi:1-acyl-sn-glycerol-3-phosphate acyltransferase